MADKVGDYLVKRLREWGIRRVFGYPGDGINGLIAAFDRAGNEPKLVQVRHEEMAAFMACAHAKFTGEVGVCLATSGPGAIHLLNGLYDAHMDRQPVLAIVGQQARTAIGGDYQQEVDLVSLFKDVSHQYVHMASTPAQVRHLLDRAIRIAISERAVATVIVPKDVQEEPAVPKESHEHGTVHTGIGYVPPLVVPYEHDLKRAAEVLNEGRRVAMLVGAGALHATDEVIETADRLGAGVAKALLGKAALPDELAFVTGSIGLLGTKPSWTMMDECDTLLMVGSSFPYSEFLPKEGQARGVQIDLKARMLSLRYPMEVNLVGDSRETLKALLPMLQRKTDRSWRQKLEAEIADWWKLLQGRSQTPARPLNPQLVFWELSPRLPDGVILSSDSGSVATWFARDLRVKRGMMASLSGNLATMGCGVPYAIGAKFAYPERPVIAMVGDGAMQMNGNAELLTIAKYWREWSDPRLVVLVLNNRDLNQVTWELRAESGDPKFNVSQDLPDFPYAKYAESIGLAGVQMDHPTQVGPAWEEALSQKRPVVVEAVVDPSVPPLPPHITFKQASAFASAVLKRDPETFSMVRQTLRDTGEAHLKKP